MWLNEDDVAGAWHGVKRFVGVAWHQGQKVLGTVDRFANVGMRLLGAASQTGLIKGRALESGLQAARSYDDIRGKAERFGQDASRTVKHFEASVPELSL